MISSSVHLDADVHAMQTALTFKHAADRDGRLMILDLQPAWKRPLLRLLGIKVWKSAKDGQSLQNNEGPYSALIQSTRAP
jgi:hypothetical protein